MLSLTSIRYEFKRVDSFYWVQRLRWKLVWPLYRPCTSRYPRPRSPTRDGSSGQTIPKRPSCHSTAAMRTSGTRYVCHFAGASCAGPLLLHVHAPKGLFELCLQECSTSWRVYSSVACMFNVWPYACWLTCHIIAYFFCFKYWTVTICEIDNVMYNIGESVPNNDTCKSWWVSDSDMHYTALQAKNRIDPRWCCKGTLMSPCLENVATTVAWFLLM